MRVCQLRQKEVINICTCKSLGVPFDLEFDEKTGCVTAIIVPLPGKICGFFGPVSEYVIPFECIKQIGEDIILVEIKEEKFLKELDKRTLGILQLRTEDLYLFTTEDNFHGF